MSYSVGMVALQGPNWFFGIDSVFELIGTITLLLIFLASYKAYKITDMKRYKYYSIAFLVLMIGHLSRTITNFAIHQNWFPIEELKNIFILGYGAHIVFTLAALVLLVSFAFEVKQKKSFCILLLLILSMLFISSSFYLAFYWAAFVMFGFIAWYLIQNARTKKIVTPKLVAVAFVFLTFTQLMFLGSSILPELYMGAHISQLLGFLILFIAMVKVQAR